MLYAGVGDFGNAQFPVDVDDEVNLFAFCLRGVGLCVEDVEKILAFGIVFHALHGSHGHEGLLSAKDIATNALSEGLFVAETVETVVLELECQSDFFGKGIKDVAVLVRSPCQQCADFCRASQQDAGLEPNHFDVFLLGDVVAFFEIHVILLSFANFDCAFQEAFVGFLMSSDALLCHLSGCHE